MIDFEKLALKALLDGQVSLVSQLRVDYFTKGNIKLYEKILEFFASQKRIPTYSELGSLIQAKAPANVVPQFLAIISSLQNITDAVDNDLVVQELKESFTIREVDKEIVDLVEANKTKDTKEVKRLLNLLNEKVNLGGIKVKDLADVKDEDETHTLVRTFLDREAEAEFFGGGHTGLTIYSAESGGGKSIALGQTALNNYKDGKNVFFISLELSRKVMYNRLISAESGVDFSVINDRRQTPEQQKLMDDAHKALFDPSNKNKFLIIDDDITDGELINLVAVESQINNIDVFVIDYLQLVEPDGAGDEWKSLTKLCKRLHKLTKQYNIAIISASQVNEEGTEKGSILPKISSRGSKEVKFSSSQFIHFAKDRETGMLNMFQMKNRIAKMKHLILEPEFEHMKMNSTGVELTI